MESRDELQRRMRQAEALSVVHGLSLGIHRPPICIRSSSAGRSKSWRACALLSKHARARQVSPPAHVWGRLEAGPAARFWEVAAAWEGVWFALG